MNLFLKHIFLFPGLCLLFSVSLNDSKFLDSDDGYLTWHQRKLKWSDFQGEVPGDSEFHALTHSAISLDFQGEGTILEFKIQSIFDPKKSWKRVGVDDYVLNHEQGHFDITEYHARLLRKKLKTAKYKSFSTVSQDIQEMFNLSYTSANEMQIQYDEQTRHSIDRKKQKKWDKKIKKLLSSTSAYKNPKLRVDVRYLTE